MKRLIEDLLAYSQVGSKGKPFAWTDCEIVLGKALRALQPAIEESAATVTQDPLATVMGDESQLLQLFQNLIGNAIKYRDSKPPVVRVLCKQGCDVSFHDTDERGKDAGREPMLSRASL